MSIPPAVQRIIPVSHEQLVWSLAYWGVWIFVLFLVPEVVGALNITPLRTLSGTVDRAEIHRKMLADAIFFFVIGVAIHWRFGLPFGRVQGAMMVCALATRFIIGV